MSVTSVSKKVLSILLVIQFILTPFAVQARTIDDNPEEIDSKKTEISDANSTIEEIEGELELQRAELEQAQGARTTLAVEIAIDRKETELLQRKLEDLEEQRELNTLEQEKREIIQNELVAQSYVNWKQSNMMREVLNSDGTDIVKVTTYQTTLASNEQKNIEQLDKELKTIQEDLKASNQLKGEYEERIANLNNDIKIIEAQLADLDAKILANQGDISNYRGKIGALQSDIDQLTAEQKSIQEAEAQLTSTADNGGTKSLETGDIYFQGVGRELYQGHGVGMSQFGALGAALAGWDAEKIVEFYYPGAKVSTYRKRDTITVDGYGAMDVETYVAGAGEVPDHSCEELDIPFDHSNIWKCWPEEAIKAQMIAFRSYGISKTMNGSSICTSAKCQVYKGGTNKQWAAEETKEQVLLFGGEPITAFYSSDNHNGWGTANNETVWSNMSGEGVAKPYLRAVNDSAIAFNYTYTDWGWRTNGYTMEDINEMFIWSTTDSSASGSYKSFLSEILQETGTIQELDFERDPSGRVSKVRLIGTNGSRYIAGWLFKSVWNIWVGNEAPSGETDYLYSLTYYKRTK